MNNRLQKTKTLALGRIAALSAIKENLRVKTAFQKTELPPTSPRVLFHNDPNGSSSSYDYNGGDVPGSPPLLFSAISSYKPEKNGAGQDRSHGSHSTECPVGEIETTLRSSSEQPISYLIQSVGTSESDQRATVAGSDGPAAAKGGYQETLLFKQSGNEHLFDRMHDHQFVIRQDSDPEEARIHGGPDLEKLHLSGICAEEILSFSRPDMQPSESAEDEDEDEDWLAPPKVSGLTLDKQGLLTGDKWVARHPDLVRVIGGGHDQKAHSKQHAPPFSAETPLTTLMHFGFLTPTALHFVHNHKSVPFCSWDSWAIQVTGDDENSIVGMPKTVGIRDLLLFPSTRFPVTLMCSGNRGKELSRVGRPIEGLHWGPGAVGTSVWGGARLRDVLRHCGVKRRRGYFVNVVGADGYGTSIPLAVAMDESRDVLLAYEQNMELLTPDHGFPVRLIVPGFTAGRSVKWLVKVHISATDSANHYHLRENRMLPSHVEDIHTAISDGWMRRPEFVITDMNVNSAISSPAHNCNILSSGPSNPMTDYSIRGYAYSGAGMKISRVEVSLNGGKGWKLCKIEHPEKPTQFGKYWCWCFWELTVELDDLAISAEIVVRAWDSAMNTQPEFYSWNVLGLMNNCWYRVKIRHEHSVDEDEPPLMTFEHPTQPGSIAGGWLPETMGAGHEMSRIMSVKLRHSESSSSLDIGDKSPRTPRPWRI